MPGSPDGALTGPARRNYTQVITADKRRESYTDYPDATNDEVTVWVNGLSVASTNTAGLRTSLTYDLLGRLQQTDQWTGNTDTNLGPTVLSGQLEYVSGTLLLQRQKEKNATGAWITAQEQAYYADARPKWTLRSDGRYTRLAYSGRGLQTHRWGDGVTPERWDYDSTYGDLEYLRTYRGGTGWESTNLPSAFTTATNDATRWVRDAATGLVLQKIDAANTTNRWSYDGYNRLQTSTSARGLALTNVYDAKTAEITRIDYSDTTPDETYTYTRLGLLETVADVTGTRTLTYRTSSDYQLSDETLDGTFYGANLHLRNKYNATHARFEGLTLGVAAGPTAAFTSTHLDLSYGFNAANARLTSIQANTRNATKNHTFSFSYLANSDLISQVSGPQSTLWKRVYEPFRATLKTVSVERGATVYARYAHGRDDLGRVTLEQQDGLFFQGYGTNGILSVNYAYDARGQLQAAALYVNSNSVPLTDRYFSATYDNAANRTVVRRVGTTSAYDRSYTPNVLNQYSSRGNLPYDDARGMAPLGVTVSVVAQSTNYYPTRPGNGQYWAQEVAADNSTNSLTVAATVKHNGVTVETQQLRYRRAQETLQWDAAGNLTNDAILAFTYDAADRLVEIKDRTAPTTRTELRYDYLGRRVEEKDYTVGTLTRQRRFVWAGWELIGEVDVNVSTGAKTMQRTFTWGPDLSGTIHGVAGIGGLLLVDHSSTQQTVAGADGRGNVTVLLDALATDPNTPANNLKAGVEYAPYGEIMRMTGDLAQMPFRFQSKWAMGQGWAGSWALELLDFGRRMYAPGLGRFISRDPAGETAGANLYHYCGNDPINQMDPLGLIQMRLIRLPWDPWGDSRSFASHPSLWGFFSSPFGNLDWGSDFWWDPDTGDVYGQSGGSLASVGNVNAAAGRSPGGSGRSGGGGSSGASGASGGGGSSGGSGSINTTTSRISPGSVVGDNLRQIPLLGGVLGALGDIVTGVFNTVLAPVQSGTLLRGPAQIAGGLGELVGRVLSAPDTAVGLVFGGVGCVFGATPDWDPRAAILRFTDMPTWLMPSAMSLGTVNVFGGRSPPDSDNGLAIGTSTGREESLHTVQSRMLGPLYFPLHIVAGATSILTPPGSSSNPGLPPWHRNNFLEQGPMRGRVF